MLEPLKQQLDAYALELGAPVRYTDAEALSFWNEKVLQTAVQPDTFHTVLDFRKVGFSYVHGLQEALGISGEFSFWDYLQRIHPDMLELYLLWGMEAMNMANNYKLDIDPFNYTYRIALPLLHENGSYLWAFQNSTAFQLDEKNQLVSQLNTYRLGVALHEGEITTMKGEFFAQKASPQAWNKIFLQRMGKKILEVFTPKEVQLLRSYAAGIHNSQEVSKRFHVSQNTIYTHNKHITRKASDLFRRGFHNALEVSDYLKNNGYLTLDT